MGREIDRRRSSSNATPDREAELKTRAADVSERLPAEHHLRIDSFDAITGNPAVVVSEAAPNEQGNYIQRALEHVQRIGSVLGLGLEAAQTPEYVADPQAHYTSSGAVAVHLQQQLKGVPIFQAAQVVRFGADGRLQETAGSSVTANEEVAIAPKLSVQEAVLRAAQHVAEPDADEYGATDQFGEPLTPERLDVSDFVPRVIAAFSNKPEIPTVLEAGPFGDEIKANLTWFPLGDDLRLGWEMVLTLPRHTEQYRTIVDAEDGAILYCRQLVQHIAARANVFRVDGNRARQFLDCPLPLASYNVPLPANLPANFPEHWVHANDTAGNFVIARMGDDGPPVQGVVQSDRVIFNPADEQSDEQLVLNLFFLNCFLHDYFYLLGFREAQGNFQLNNFGRGGSPSDRVDARVYSGPVDGTATMTTAADGRSPIMRMGRVTRTNRHTALDSSVVFHEFMHGVTNRLVGGPMNVQALEAEQSAGMGEGWGDYIACTLNKTAVVAAWVMDKPGGLRAFPYDSNFPDTFANLGAGRYTRVHNIGEIWCATLMEMNRRIGDLLGVQLVVDALKLSRANPSFLDMRDAILAALDGMAAAGQINAAQHTSARRGIWQAFAKFGMGPGARCNGATLTGIVADFRTPNGDAAAQPVVRVEANLALAIPDNNAAGVSHVLSVADSGQLKRLAVALSIEHTYIGDLRVSLQAPDGTTVTLHERQGANTQNLAKTYTTENSPALADLVGTNIRGDWTLRVADLEEQDVGELRRWSLEVTVEAAHAHVDAEPLAAGVAEPARDDFKLITGIGPAIETRLNNAGILTYAQLGALSPEEIVARLGLSGVSAKNVFKQDWVGQARTLDLRHPAEEQIARQHYATFTVELLLGEDNEVRRTRVKHIQQGEQETWAGWEDGRLVSFFVERAALRQPTLPKEASVVDLQLDVLDILVEEVPSDGQGAAEQTVERLRAQVGFEISGIAATQLTAAQANYFVHMLAYTQETGETRILAASQGRLAPLMSEYTLSLEFEPPSLGRYQLLAAVVLPDYEAVGAAVGPILRVIA